MIHLVIWYTICCHQCTMIPFRFTTPHTTKVTRYSHFSRGTPNIANELWEWYPREHAYVCVCARSVIHISASSSISGLLTRVPELLYLCALALRAVWWRRRALLSAFSDHRLPSHGLWTARTRYYDSTLSGLFYNIFAKVFCGNCINAWAPSRAVRHKRSLPDTGAISL